MNTRDFHFSEMYDNVHIRNRTARVMISVMVKMMCHLCQLCC